MSIAYQLPARRAAASLEADGHGEEPPDREAVTSAHRPALVRLKALVEARDEPADQELLGLTHLCLGDEKAASAAFQAGLDRERIRNPQSELVAALMRRVSQIGQPANG